MKRLTALLLLALLTAGCKVFPTAGPVPTAAVITPTGAVIPTPTDTVVVVEVTPPAPTLVPATETAPTEAATEPVPTQPPADGAFSRALLENFTYRLEYTPDGLIPLQNGRYEIRQESPPVHVTSELVDKWASGDLNGDGAPDAAVLLRTNTGGSGSFYDLIVLLNQGGVPVQSGVASIGDRQVIRAVSVEGGRIVLDYLTQGIQDPFCCPSLHVLRTYVLENGAPILASEQQLVREDEVATPVPARIIIDQPTMFTLVSGPFEVRGRIDPAPSSGFVEYALTDGSASLLNYGQIAVQGAPGGPGTFSAVIDFERSEVYGTILYLEIIHGENALLLGRSVTQVILQ